MPLVTFFNVLELPEKNRKGGGLRVNPSSPRGGGGCNNPSRSFYPRTQ